MKRIFTFIAATAAMVMVAISCNRFEVENTATVDAAGNWYCSIYYSNGESWVEYYEAELVTYNTAANVATEMWLDDQEWFWGTKCKVDLNGLTFGEEGKEYTDIYNDVTQKIWGGKITVGAAKAPGTETVVDKIEFYISFSDDEEPYCTTYYFVGYRRTGFPEDDGVCIWDWELPAIQ